MDEILMWVAPDKVLYASPWKAADLLHAEIAAGRSTNSLWYGFHAADTNKTIQEVVIATNAAGYKLTTLPTPGLDDTTNSATLTFSSATFASNDILRVDDEILRVAAATGPTVTVARAQAGTTNTIHATGSVIYAYSPVMRDNLPVGAIPDICPANRVAAATNQLRQTLGSYSASFIPMPVLFAVPDGKSKYLAASANVVNCLVGSGGTIYYPATGCEVFRTYIAGVLPSASQVTDAWEDLHCQEGEVHCATAAQRVLDLSTPWWQQVSQWE